MPRRASSFGPTMSGVACALLAAVAVSVGDPAQADCIVQPNQPVPEGAHWSLHYDRAKNRRCWILVDATGHDLSAAQPESTATPTTSVFQAILGNFTGAGTPPPAQEAPAAVAPAAAAAAPPARRPAARVSANRPEHVRTERAEPREKGDAARHELTEPEREALFEEFLRWHESQQMIGTVNRSPR